MYVCVCVCVIFVGTLVGKVPSISRRKLSIFLRPSSSTEAPTDQMRLRRNQSSTMCGKWSVSVGFTWGGRGREGGGHMEVIEPHFCFDLG